MSVARLARLLMCIGLVGCGASSAATTTPTTTSSADSSPPPTPSGEVTVGVPVPQLDEARQWYATLIGRDVPTLTPADGVFEFLIADGAWLQLFATEPAEFSPSPTIVRLQTDDIDRESQRLAGVGVEVGEIVRIPDVVAFVEFTDPYGNGVGLYQVLADVPN
ncbi:MAG: VOC family protein [Myxococcota bacterium]